MDLTSLDQVVGTKRIGKDGMNPPYTHIPHKGMQACRKALESEVYQCSISPHSMLFDIRDKAKSTLLLNLTNPFALYQIWKMGHF